MLPRISNAGPTASLVLASACWGLGSVMTKRALAELTPLTLLLVQLAVSVACLWSLRLLRPAPFNWSSRLLPVGLLGLLDPGLAYTLSLLGLRTTTAAASALLWATEPLLIVGLAWLVLRERLAPRFVLLSACAVAGVGLTLPPGTGLGLPGSLAGNGFILTGVLCCALYTVLARGMGEGCSPLLAVTLQQSLALALALLIWPLGWLRGDQASLRTVTLGTWTLAALSGVVYYGLAFWFYIRGLRRMPASQAGFFINLVPLFAIGGAYVFLRETLSPTQWLGAGLILLAALAVAPGSNS